MPSSGPRSPRERGVVVAIDGPAGAGKSSVAKELARRLGYSLLDTGALYRAVALLAARRGVSWEDPEATTELASRLAVEFRLQNGENRVFIEGEDVSAAIRTAEVSEGASRVSRHPEVRRALLDLQRHLGREGGVVAEGRDVGTVVFPDAEAKFFLTADPEERAKRRFEELSDAGEARDYASTLAEMRDRDARDASRSAAPLAQAADAMRVDSTERSLQDVVDGLQREVRARERGERAQAGDDASE